jgi:hypothetical protein
MEFIYSISMQNLQWFIVKLKTQNRFHVAAMKLPYIFQINIKQKPNLTKVAYISKIYYHTKFQALN